MDLADRSVGSIKSQALYAASQGISFLIIALVFYVGALWIISGRYSTSEFFTVLTSVVSRSDLVNKTGAYADLRVHPSWKRV